MTTPTIDASAHTRDHHLSKDYTRAVLSWLEAHGRRTVNGRRVLELNKVDQLTVAVVAGCVLMLLVIASSTLRRRTP